MDALAVRGAREEVMRRLALLGILALAVRSAAMSAQPAEPLLGVWNVDVFKSTYVTGQPPVRRVMTFEPAGDSVKCTQETTNQGFNISETIKVEYTAKIDGKDYPIMNSGLDTVA